MKKTPPSPIAISKKFIAKAVLAAQGLKR